MKSAEEIFVYLFFLPLHEVILKNSCKRVESQSILLRSFLSFTGDDVATRKQKADDGAGSI